MQTSSNDPTATVFTLLLICVGVLIVGAVIVTWVRRRMTRLEGPADAGFTLSDLRRMVESGQMSPEEFERAKGRIIAATRNAAQRQATSKNTDDAPSV